jgi:hypothetical protein
LLLVVLTVSVTAGMLRFYHRFRDKKESEAVIWLYNIAAGLMMILAFVFFVRMVSGFFH